VNEVFGKSEERFNVQVCPYVNVPLVPPFMVSEATSARTVSASGPRPIAMIAITARHVRTIEFLKFSETKILRIFNRIERNCYSYVFFDL
jgi:hypothetical protein